MGSNTGQMELRVLRPVCQVKYYRKSLMAKWSEQASQLDEMYCHDLEVMSSNPSQVETWGA